MPDDSPIATAADVQKLLAAFDEVLGQVVAA